MPQSMTLRTALECVPHGKKAWILSHDGHMKLVDGKLDLKNVMALTWEGAQDWCMITDAKPEDRPRRQPVAKRDRSACLT